MIQPRERHPHPTITIIIAMIQPRERHPNPTITIIIAMIQLRKRQDVSPLVVS
jgi:uncharacterized protein (DUF2249 family)